MNLRKLMKMGAILGAGTALISLAIAVSVHDAATNRRRDFFKNLALIAPASFICLLLLYREVFGREDDYRMAQDQ